MQLHLNLEKDQELRDAVKELIQGQVRGLIRDNLSTMFNDIIEKTDLNLKKQSQTFFNVYMKEITPKINRMVQEEIRSMIAETVKKEMAELNLRTLVLAEASKAVKAQGFATNMESVVRGIVKEQLKAVLGG